MSTTFDSNERDQKYWETVENIARDRSYSTTDLLRNWPAYVMRRDIPRFLSHYELFKQVIDLPGVIVDLGVFRGTSFFTFWSLLETFCPFDRSRKVFGFDHFEGLTDFTERDGAENEGVDKVKGGYYATAEEVRALVEIHNSDNLIPNTRRAVLVEGDVAESIPRFIEENPGVRISLLHFDLDLYGPTKAALELLYPLVLKGGVVCFDEYGLVPWQGETEAVDEYFAKIGESPVINKHPFAQTPHGYFVK